MLRERPPVVMAGPELSSQLLRDLFAEAVLRAVQNSHHCLVWLWSHCIVAACLGTCARIALLAGTQHS